MKTFVVLAACVAVCVALPAEILISNVASPVAMQPQVRKPPVPILNLAYENDNQGQYSLDTQGGDQTRVHEQGQLRDLGDKEGPVVVTSGSYSYIGTDGRTYTVNWTADENGYKAVGDHFPTQPPIPEEIRKSLQGQI